MLLDNSNLKFYEWSSEINWDKQGTGSQRALFWAMMQVRSELKAVDDVKKSNENKIRDILKRIKKLQREADKAKKEETKKSKLEEIERFQEEIKKIEKVDSEKLVEEQRVEYHLPGYMLLIDEPEVALHPNAVRAASSHLYNLSEDDSWQVMLTTHAPAFINPLEDHTTIVRLDRDSENPTPKTFRSDTIQFLEEEKENLKLLNRYNLNLSEMFFGQYPILIEGDTEYAAFEYIMNKYYESYKINNRPILIRAHGKYTIPLIMKILSHFKVNFSVLHDSDFPFRRDGKTNNAWSANKIIFDAVNDARKNVLNVIHRVSIPYFELEHYEPEVDNEGSIIDPDSKDKPWNMVSQIKNDVDLQTSVKAILDTLREIESDPNPYGKNIEISLEKKLKDWATKREIKDSRIFKLK